MSRRELVHVGRTAIRFSELVGNGTQETRPLSTAAIRWPHLRDELHDNVGDGLNKGLAALEEENTGLEGVLHHIDFTRTVGKSKLSDKKLRELVQHFSKYRLRNDDFEFPDLLGAAYEYLIGELADSAGKKGGEFYTDYRDFWWTECLGGHHGGRLGGYRHESVGECRRDGCGGGGHDNRERDGDL